MTGAASGIGRATALLFAREGARVAVADRDENGAHETVRDIESLGGNALFIRLDVTNEADWERAVADLLARWSRLDILVNNAGISAATPIAETPLDDWRRVMAVNLDGTFLGTKHALAAMRTTGGSIVNVSSASGSKATAGAAAYCTSKAAVRMLARVAALEGAQNDPPVRVNSVLPGGVMTPMWESMDFWKDLVAQTGSVAESWKAIAQDVPLKRFATAEEVAQAILFFASDESRFVTGAELAVDGGYTA